MFLSNIFYITRHLSLMDIFQDKIKSLNRKETEQWLKATTDEKFDELLSLPENQKIVKKENDINVIGVKVS